MWQRMQSRHVAACMVLGPTLSSIAYIQAIPALLHLGRSGWLLTVAGVIDCLTKYCQVVCSQRASPLCGIVLEPSEPLIHPCAVLES